MTVSYADLPSLLHDASLSEFHWDRSLSEMRLEFADCLRQTGEAEDLEHTTLLLSGVRAIAAYEPLPRLLDGKKPESNRALLTERDLSWTNQGAISFTLNSRRAQFELESTDRRDWLHGTVEEAEGCRFNFHMSTIKGHLFVACETIECRSGGSELSLETWAEECGQWWDAWKQYWQRGEGGNAQFDTTIPVSAEPPAENPHPIPQRTACVLKGDAPPDLVAPILDYHEGHIDGNWSRMSRAWPDFDKSPENQAANMHARLENGPWVYLRRIDSWWIEGAMAYLQVRGVEHRPDAREGSPQNLETVIGYELRRFENGWIIWNLSQGWVQYGSASALSERETWHDEWNLDHGAPPPNDTPRSKTSPDATSDSAGQMPLPNAGHSPETAKIAAAALVTIGITLGIFAILLCLAFG